MFFWSNSDSYNLLTDTYLSCIKPDAGSAQGDVSRLPNTNDDGFLGNVNSYGNQPSSKEESISFSTASEPSRLGQFTQKRQCSPRCAI